MLFLSPVSPRLQSVMRRISRPKLQGLFVLAVALSGSVALTGCSSRPYNVSPTSGLPAPPPSVPTSNAYLGSQSPVNWSLTVDDKQNAYSYQSLPSDGSKPAAASGTFVPQSGFLNLGKAGLALEIPGAGAVLRPGDNTTGPVVMVEEENCFALTGKQRYMLQGMVDSTALTVPSVVYRRGDVVASTTSDAKTWSFTDAEFIDSNGNPLTLVYQGQNSPNAFTGTCAAAQGASSVTIDVTGAYNLPTSFRFDSAGLAVADYATYPSAIGVAQPLNPIDTKSLVASNFRGFQIEYSPTIVTQPVSFEPAIDGSAALNGGTYPGDDVTQTADSSALFQFGPQSTFINGLFAGATMTVLDPTSGCAANGKTADTGLTPNGVPTCRLHLSTMVGQLSGKAFIVASGFDFTLPTVPDIQLYLVQQ